MPSEPLRTPEVESLLEAFASLDSADDVYAFLLDVCTIREIQEMAQRLAVARMLAGGVHYPEIQRVTGASPTTISRVSRCVNYGSGGYEKVIERLGTIEGPGETP
jgi:TrpR-related protein YerC/YecD